MKLRTKLFLGLGFLFFLTLVVGGLGAYFLNKLAQDAHKVIKDNYESIVYTKEMILALENMNIFQTSRFNDGRKDIKNDIFETPQFRRFLTIFEQNLALQQQNITEQGEEAKTLNVANTYQEYNKLLKRSEIDTIPKAQFFFEYISPTYDLLVSQVFDLLDMNMQAIIRKNEILQTTAQNVTISLIVVSFVCSFLSLVFVINFPTFLLKSIQKLRFGIKQITFQNYDQRLEIDSKDELGELAAAFNDMAQRLYEYENSQMDRLLFEKKRNEAIINTMQDGMIGIDENKTILFANPAISQLIAMNEEELLGKYAPDIALHNDLFRNLLQSLLQNDTDTKIKIWTNNQEKHFQKECLSILKEKKEIGKVLMLKNITDLYQQSEAKSNFMAAISHELKTPISSINMSLKLLEDKRVGKLNEEQNQLVKQLKDDAQRLLKITQDLLELARIESGNVQMVFQYFPPHQLIEASKNTLQMQIQQKNQPIRLEIEPNLPLIYADLDKSVWVLKNLLANALNHSQSEKEIVISAKAQDHSVVFSVQDFGKGIEEKYLNKIFEKFFQIPDKEGNKIGTGLGLAIAKEFIQLQSGTIWVESQVEKGSKFSFALPLAT
jgi:PAS domain S-box-containing protein